MSLLIFFCIGTILSSFMYVVVERLPLNEDFIRSRSRCDLCRHQLRWHDLIPIVSYLILKGRCRYCHRKISSTYVLVELYGGLLFVNCWLRYKDGLTALLAGLFLLTLTALAFIDEDYFLIPDELIITLIIICALFFLFIGMDIEHLAGLLIPLSLIMVYFYREDLIGEGDLYVLIPLSLYLGLSKGSIMLLIASISGLMEGYYYPCHKRIPFVPHLLIGTLITIFCF